MGNLINETISNLKLTMIMADHDRRHYLMTDLFASLQYA